MPHIAFPTPAETQALAIQEIDAVANRHEHTSLQDFNAFLNNPEQSQSLTKKGDKNTNIIDQNQRTTYNFNPESIQEMFKHLERMRKDGIASHFSEKQGTVNQLNSGLMFDYDMYVDSVNTAIDDRQLHRIAGQLVKYLRNDLLFEGEKTVTLKVFNIVKKKPLFVAPGKYKYGFHVLIPEVQVHREYKKYLLRQIKADAGICSALKGLSQTEDPKDLLDMNSASVPVLFLGSCKRGGIPYILGPSFEVSFEPGTDEYYYPMINRINIKKLEIEGYNMVAELSLCREAVYSGRAPYVKKREYDYRTDIKSKVIDIANRTAGNIMDEAELLIVEHELSTLAIHDPKARFFHQLLDLLDDSYYTDRNKWRNVIFALANTSEQYKPLAEWFSQKCPLKWKDGGLTNLNQIWGDAILQRSQNIHDNTNIITERSISMWAQQCNPERYRQVMSQNYFIILSKYVYTYGGILEHFMIADVLCAMLRNKFIVDIDSTDTKGKYCWYEFVVPGQSLCSGEVWKWRKESHPDELQKYISRNLVKVFQQVSESIEKRAREADDEGKKKYYVNLGKKFATSQRKIFNDTFKNCTIKQAHYLFRRRGFADSLDKDPLFIGVGNGVLELGSVCSLINYYHEIPISSFTPTHYKKFDPEDPYIKLILGAMKTMIPERDMRDWILFNAAQCLAGGVKEGLLFLWYGGGANGKTFIMRLIAKVLGKYATKLNISLFTSERESADKPNSAVMQLKGCRFGYVEETKKSEVLNDQRLKEVVNAGDISARDLNTKQECFEVTANIFVGQNYDFVIKTRDHGTWRRIKHYTSKVRFCPNPNPDNPFDRQDDPRYVNEYVKDPNCHAAMLSILVHYYERLQREYNGKLKRVRCETLDRETEMFRNAQDPMNMFITEHVVVSPSHPEPYSLEEVGKCYLDWHQKNISKGHLSRDELAEEIGNSALQKYIKRFPDAPSIITGVRILAEPTDSIESDESYIGLTKINMKQVKTDEDEKWWNPPVVTFGESDAQIDTDTLPAVLVEGGSLAEYGSDNSWMNMNHTGVDTLDENDYDNDDMLLMSGINKPKAKSREPNLDEYLDDIIERQCKTVTVEDIYSDDSGTTLKKKKKTFAPPVPVSAKDKKVLDDIYGDDSDDEDSHVSENDEFEI